MSRVDITALLRKADPYRNEFVELDGELVPKSAVMLMSVLATEIDPTVRFQLYSLAVSECGLADKTAAAVKLAHAQYQDLQDLVSLTVYSKALAQNGEVDAGLARAEEALELAIQEQTCVNFAAENLVWRAIDTGSTEAVNDALDALAHTAEVPRKGDCAFEADWVDAAEALGADQEMVAWGRAVAARRPPVTRRGKP